MLPVCKQMHNDDIQELQLQSKNVSLYNVQSNILLFKYAVSDQTKMNILVLDDFLKNTISFLR